MTRCVLAIAASDPSGGAGIEADLKVLSAHRVFGLTALTALTVQDSAGVRSVHPTDPAVFRRVLSALSDDQPLAAVKMGALATRDHLEAAREFIESLPRGTPVVLDPVLKATSGAELTGKEAAAGIKDLLPLVTVVTPNMDEAGALTGRKVMGLEDMKRSAEELCLSGARAALVKGGHLKSGSKDVLFHRGMIKEWDNDRIPHEFHGTGCALSSAIAARMAGGAGAVEAVRKAREYLRLCMSRARPGKGVAYILDFPPALQGGRSAREPAPPGGRHESI